ncbi:tail completion protein gp17 [Yoonia vestfoldensis]|uniref:DUF3168 domain-containing protein n=1 Tax=Yoonia vestfoldensis TaxID=245188 RepID=A0A1Y0EHW3_9RHOB|nr:DUF3168 domain-containing protein [Yoonia vestfoldensis]ARU02971.1 hypothetical protein LOKVESSMR4R_03705 [Yoonia vestfoldensis]
MEEAFRTILAASPAVSGIAGDRINFGTNVQGARYPRIVMFTIDDAEGHNLDGPDGHSIGRVQVDCYAMSYEEAKLLSRTVRAVLDGYSGDGFQGVFHALSRDTREGGSNEAKRPFRVSLDFITHYNPT